MLSVEDDAGEAALQKGYKQSKSLPDAISFEDDTGEAAFQKKLINHKSLSVS